MKDWKEILENTQVQNAEKIRTMNLDMWGVTGFIKLRDCKNVMTFMATIDDENNGKKWEHVSVAYYGDLKKTPSWAEMCVVKEVFWSPEEEVHQIHPKESQYVHGFRGKDNILHLWRPVGGWENELKTN